MNLRSKKPRPLSREERTFRDDRFFVIATEDTYAPEQYFRIFKNPRIKVHVLPTEGGHSAPKHVIERLNEFAKDPDLIDDDELWLMLDTDHWIEPNHIAGFTEVCAEAVQKGFKLAHSNPCFEVWLLLHVADLNAAEQFRRSEDVVERLREILGGYSKRTVDPAHFSIDAAREAVARAESLDSDPNARWPQNTGSHVYKVVKRLLSA
jgi:uncharacterized Fe-S cluster-containing radical SAM superfamily protein